MRMLLQDTIYHDSPAISFYCTTYTKLKFCEHAKVHNIHTCIA